MNIFYPELYQLILGKRKPVDFSWCDISVISFDSLAGLHLSKVEKNTKRWKKYSKDGKKKKKGKRPEKE